MAGADLGRAGGRTPSGIEVPPVVTAADLPPEALSPTRLGVPGEPPFTRGVHPTMYRGRLWTMRQYAGFGSAQATNRRFRYLLEQGQSGLSVAFDLPTQMGLDSDAERARGEVGRVGVAVDSLEDVEELLRDIPLERVSVSMTINATAPILLAMVVALADERGVPRAALRGTVQNDILKEFAARGTYIYPPRSSLRLAADVIAWAAAAVPSWNPISISGYHMREAGATAPQEIAFTFANALAYVDAVRARGLTMDAFGPRLSFFFAAHNDLFEEVAKFRAARRLWWELSGTRGATDPRARMLRFHTQTAGSALTAQQPDVNVVRVAIQALAAVLGGTQSLHTNAYDEALGLPTADSARLALRTQQVVAYESGAAATADPLGGSYYVEWLTDRVEGEARALLAEVERLGGAVAAVESGYVSRQIEDSAYRYQQEVEGGARVVVGVNRFVEAGARAPVPEVGDPEAEERQRRALAERRRRRDGRAALAALAAVREAARRGENVMDAIVDAVKARATVGEISDAMREVFGEQR